MDEQKRDLEFPKFDSIGARIIRAGRTRTIYTTILDDPYMGIEEELKAKIVNWYKGFAKSLEETTRILAQFAGEIEEVEPVDQKEKDRQRAKADLQNKRRQQRGGRSKRF